MNSKPIICFSIGYTPDFNKNLDGVYGAEFALKNLAEEFSNTHKVCIFGSMLNETCVNNVFYYNSNSLNNFMTENTVEIMIISRYINHFLEFDNKAKKTYIWLHDTVAHSAWNGLFMPQEGKFLLQNIIHKIDGIVVLTEWHKEFVKLHYSLDPDKIYIIGNAIDTSRYNKQVERVKNRFIYTSNPNRGLRELVFNFSKIKEKLPDAELWVYRGEDDFKGEYKDFLELMKTIPYIKFMGRLDNNELVEHQMKSDFWYYPTNWAETYCISALECMAAGCICITSNLAALKDTVGDRGILLKNSIHSASYFEEAENKIVEIANDDSLKEHFRSKGIEWARNQSWKLRAKEWLQLFGYKDSSSKITVKLMTNWTDNKSWTQICKRFCKPNQSWNNIFFTEEEKADFYCIVNFPRPDEYWEPEKSILLSMEEIENRKAYFPNEWISPQTDNFFYYYYSQRNSLEWHLSKSYTELLSMQIEKTKCLSSVTSSEYRLPGHVKRINLLTHFEKCGLQFDLYGRSNKFGFRNYIGSLPPYQKDNGIFPYKYTIACENASVDNYFTEKIVDAILGECLCFYYGCPNINMFIDERAYILIDPDDYQKSLQIIIDAISNNEWEKRIDIIKKEKLKILNEMQLIPVIESIITKKNSLKSNFLDDCSIQVLNLERRRDRWDAFIKHAEEIGLKDYKRFDATDGKKLVIDEKTSKLFEVKEGFVGKRWPYLTHNYFAGILGAALSHLRIWKEASLTDKVSIIFEDDVILDDHFVEKWNDIYSNIKYDLRWDILYFGFNDDEYGESYGDVFVHPGVMKFSSNMRLHGAGAYGYVLRQKGAQKLVELVDKLGIQQPIDHFIIDHFDTLCVYKTVPHLVKAKIYGINNTDTDIQNCRTKIEDTFFHLNLK